MSHHEVTDRILTQAGSAVRALNPHVFNVGCVDTTEWKPNQGPALERKLSARPGRGTRVASGQGPVARVALVAFRRRLLDSDNLQTGLKPLRDVIARELGLDDNDQTIAWEYGQVRTDGEQGTAVRIEILTPPTP